MAVIEVNSENFEKEVINSSVPVLADFNAQWCGPCKMLKPILDEIAAERSDCKVVSIDVDEEMELAMQFGVSSIPCIVAFKDGKEAGRSVGLIPKEKIEELL